MLISDLIVLDLLSPSARNKLTLQQRSYKLFAGKCYRFHKMLLKNSVLAITMNMVVVSRVVLSPFVYVTKQELNLGKYSYL